jgi:hypothetical protein
MRMAAVVLAATLVACGEGGDDCDLSKIHGSYLVAFETIDGSCGPQAGALVQIVTLQPTVADGCVFASANINDVTCQGSSEFNCVFPSSNASLSYRMVMNLDDGKGDVITGTQSMTAYYLNTGAFWCAGNYRVTFTRQ